MKQVLPICLLIVLLFSCKSVPKVDGNLLNGMIYDEENEPVANVMISVDGKYLTSSDVDGHFILNKELNGNNIKIICSKKEYEDVEIECELLSVPQLVYIKMSSFYQLLSLAEREILDNRIDDAQKTLERAEAVNPEQITTRYLRAVCFYKQSDLENALLELEKIKTENKFVELLREDVKKDLKNGTLTEQ